MLKALYAPEAVTKETPSTPLKPVEHVNEVPPLNKGEKSKTPAQRTPVQKDTVKKDTKEEAYAKKSQERQRPQTGHSHP
jgi:Rieske Fe-S protein